MYMLLVELYNNYCPNWGFYYSFGARSSEDGRRGCSTDSSVVTLIP